MDEQKDYSHQSFRQCLFQTVSYNGSMLPSRMGSTLFRYTFHLWLWHKIRQILHLILKKCLKACKV